jgi:hypothetical protein
MVEAAGEEVAFAGGVRCEQLRPTFARLPFPVFAIDEQTHFAREARKGSHCGAAGIVLDDELRNIQFVLLALIVLAFIIYRKDVRYEYRGTRRN